MKPDQTAPDTDLSSIPGEFRENYRFLCELINCRDKNDAATRTLQVLADKCPVEIKGRLNRRQSRIFTEFLTSREAPDPDSMTAPVPAELEASIRVRRRSTWLPWEAEAIHKIELWRQDVACITGFLASTSVLSDELRGLRILVPKHS